MAEVPDYRKAVELLKKTTPMEEGPTRWAIVEEDGGWSIEFSGPINGRIHPKSFCQMIIDDWNKEG